MANAPKNLSSYLSNLAGEYAAPVGRGYRLRLTLPANWDENLWDFAAWAPASFKSTDGLTHVLFEARKDGSDYIRVSKTSGGDVKLETVAGGTSKSATITPSSAWVRDTAVFVGVTFDGTDATLYLGRAGQTSVQTATISSVGTFTSGTWLLYGGSDYVHSRNWEGWLSLVVTAVGASTPITDRYATGDGESLGDWLNIWAGDLVVHTNDDQGGTDVSAETASGWTPTVTRADTARQATRDGTVESVSNNVLRNRHFVTANDGNQYGTTLLERAYTNLVTSSDLSTWNSPTGLPVTSGQADPAGGSTAYLLSDPSGGATRYRAVTFTGDGTKAFLCAMKAGTATQSYFALWDNTAAAWRHRVLITWSGGVPSLTTATGGGVLFDVVPLANGFYGIKANATGIVAANANQLYIYPSVGAAGTLTVWLPGTFNDPVRPSLPLDASDTQARDDFTLALLDATPQEATYLYEGVVADLPGTGGANYRYLFNVGDAGNGVAGQLGAYLEAGSGRIYLAFRNDSAEVTGYWLTPSLALDDYITIRIYQASSGAITAGLKINGDAEDTTLDGAIGTQALPGSWHSSAARFSARASAVYPANSALISFKAISGPERTLAQMQALTKADCDIAFYASGQSELVAQSFDVAQLHGQASSNNALIGYLNHADDGTVSGGSYEANLPVTNLQDALFSKVARTTDAAKASTQFSMDLGAADPVRIFCLAKHNLSLAALVRLRAYDNSGHTGTPAYDTDWIEAYPPCFPEGVLPTDHPAYADRKLTADQYADGVRLPFIHVLPSSISERYWLVEVDDTANADGYVEFGRLIMSYAWQPSIGFAPGAAIGHRTSTTVTETDGDALYFRTRARRREVKFTIPKLDLDEALSFGLDLQRDYGIDEELFFVWDPTDVEHLQRRSFPGYLRELSALEQPFYGVDDVPLAFTEKL